MEINIESVKELREETGLSITECQKALTSAGGDFEKARALLRKRGSLAREKKATRNLSAGAIAAYIHNTGQIGGMIELLCETDFVSKNEEFIKLAEDIAMHTVATNPRFVKVEDIPENEREQLKQELKSEMGGEVPKDKVESILESKFNARLKDSVLLLQPFIQDETQTINDLISSATQKFGERIEIDKIIVFQI